ncbi:MAG: alpha/beta hydrolase [Chloroflexi bacterium]|nr:alpha/beta hydrolase [Chloroflexota bacterium]
MSSPLRKSYVDGPYGQVHLLAGGPSDGAAPPLYLLHATAYSAQPFEPLMERLARSRQVIAPDTPGYGGSDSPPELPPFERYADAFVDLVARTAEAGRGPVDVFGYHTGTLIATEAAARRPDLFRSLILVGVPYYLRGAAREERRAILAERADLTEDFEQFRARWEYFVPDRTPGLSLERGYACFVDELRAYPRHWWAHEALFTYAAEDRLPLVECPVLVLNPNNALAEPSRDASRLMLRARVVELPALASAIFDLGADVLAGEIERFLDGLPS